MHVQVASYRMTDISDADFIAANKEFAAMMSVVPGLLAKVWLKDLDDNVYGGIYLWQDREARQAARAPDRGHIGALVGRCRRAPASCPDPGWGCSGQARLRAIGFLRPA